MEIGNILTHRRSIAWLVVLAAGMAVSCGDDATDDTGDRLSVLRVAVLPDESVEAIRQRYSPLLDFVSDYIGIPYKLTIVERYEDLVDVIVRGEVDLAHFGGYSYVLARDRIGVLALVQRDLDTRFTSYLIARREQNADRLSDFQKRVLCFGSRLSTSGHLMPRSFLVNRGIVPEDFFREVIYSGAHDLTVLSVVGGEADGRLAIESTPGEGTSVSAIIPLVEAPGVPEQ